MLPGCALNIDDFEILSDAYHTFALDCGAISSGEHYQLLRCYNSHYHHHTVLYQNSLLLFVAMASVCFLHEW